MFEVNGTTITITKADSGFAEVGMKKPDTGEIYEPQQGDVIKFGVKKYTSDETCLIEKTIPNDTRILALEPADTKNMEPGEYVYDVELTYENGIVDTFINNQPFIVDPEVV